MRRKLALWLCPALHDEIKALQDGNTKVVLENGRLLDEIATYRIERTQQNVSRLMQDPDINRMIHASQPVMRQS